MNVVTKSRIDEHYRVTDERINVLWTSGWDSSFRTLYLALVEKKQVQPYYVIDESRKSLRIELKAMENIRKALRDLDPEAADRIHETHFVRKADIPDNPEITRKFHELNKIVRWGSQFEWLAIYAESCGISNLEIGLTSMSLHVIPNLVAVELPGMRHSPITHRYIAEDDRHPYSIFKYFSFPIITLSKLDMGEIAKKRGFAHIMEETWFCHKPTKQGTPCGFCYPCRDAVKSGLGRRVPKHSRLKRAVNWVRSWIRETKQRLRA